MDGAISTKTEPAQRRSAWRGFVVVSIFLALVLQGYLTQTHLHGLFPESVASQTGNAPGHDKYPLNDDPARCPVCQQIVHGSQFVAPGWLTPFLLVLAISTIEIVDIALPHFNSVSHSWRGRGPPLH